jgi:hypothetical protein
LSPCLEHAECGMFGFCTKSSKCKDKRKCTPSPGFPKANPIDGLCPPTNADAQPGCIV